MLDRLERIEQRYLEIDRQMSRPEVASDLKQLQELAQERSGLEGVVAKYRELKKASKELEDVKSMHIAGTDEEMTELVKQEVASLEAQQEKLLGELKLALLPKDPNDEKDIIVEIRAGAGGEEAGLFAAELLRMYQRYSETRGWKFNIQNSSETGVGGIKEAVFQVQGSGAYSRLKLESGVHRVQRVPVTESQGRIHTSTATVAVLPKAEEIDIEIKQSDLRVDVFHSGGAGGQNVNKVATAIRITHEPTGLVVQAQKERSQNQNRQVAMEELRARLWDQELKKQQDEISANRKAQVGSGDRSEKIRTYNFQQGRVTDHRIHMTSHSLAAIMEGDIDEFIDALLREEQALKLAAVTAAG